MRFGYQAVGWRNPLSEIAVQVAQMGFHGLEVFGVTELLPSDQNLSQVLTAAKVEFVGAYFASSLVEKDARETNVQSSRGPSDR